MTEGLTPDERQIGHPKVSRTYIDGVWISTGSVPGMTCYSRGLPFDFGETFVYVYTPWLCMAPTEEWHEQCWASRSA
jgi:hypothetical protein